MEGVNRAVRQLAADKAATDEQALKVMLGYWISESEPSAAYAQSTGELIGLSDPGGSIVVRRSEVEAAEAFRSYVEAWRPFRDEWEQERAKMETFFQGEQWTPVQLSEIEISKASA